jgi:hypothetical protein
MTHVDVVWLTEQIFHVSMAGIKWMLLPYRMADDLWRMSVAPVSAHLWIVR